MVSISKLINNGLLLVGQSVFEDVATPQQAAVEQYNVVKFLGGSAPYVQRNGFGINTDLPDQCTYEQVQLFSRHGERYPAQSDGKNYEPIWKKFQSYNGTYKGSLAFLNDYEYFVPNSELYEKETTPGNSQGLYSGTTNALRHGAYFRSKYNSLYNENSTEPLPIFTSNSGRCAMTSNYFARGFLGEDYEEGETVVYNIIAEEADQGANSLTPRISCNTYNSSLHNDVVNKYNTSYLNTIQKRLVGENPGLNLTATDVSYLFGWCAYEINVRGASPFCDIFTNEEFIKNSYHTDLSNYYSNGPGNNATLVIGSTLLNASLALLLDEEAENKIWLSFSHDTDLEIFHSALGIVEPSSDLPTDYVPFPSPYVHSSIVPQSARIYTEKFSCDGTSYVRYIINDSVVPIPKCSDGPGFSCEFSKFQEYIESRIGDVDFPEQCGLKDDVPQDVSFYWDYKSVTYNATLGNF
ncbi:secreted acid phosphatase [Scheffersomyces stipitis CBS 6054]|uniref:Secreted acid phosphatase n=1 Tax=Scheffersomyces stipitis (strain ATCC 58785 / CBS 6054 / NBRC 10063 / NRRL Y-11545) TaxID=322104 RepID=A3LV80_PICST|nr:secreted acid phosphatase [Scheffersomyces stipitis CBS 6054]ABN67079.1 secreted acid phosphatase [Scheffersomyces stipitis CBS 6054]